MDDELYADEDYKKACQSASQPGTGSTRTGGKASGTKTGGDSRVWMGRAFGGDAVAINDVLGEEQNDVILKGKVVKVEFRELKSKRILLTFQMADSTNGISAKKFLDVSNQGGGGKFRRKNTLTPEEYDNLVKKLKPGVYVRVHGNIQYDNYQNDYVLMAYDMMEADGGTVEREDHNPTPRVELHLHTVMSDMDALITVKQLIKTIKKWGHPAVAPTTASSSPSRCSRKSRRTRPTTSRSSMAWKATSSMIRSTSRTISSSWPRTSRALEISTAWSRFPI